MASTVFECEMCTENYNSGNRKPISLMCGHTFCHRCLLAVKNQNGIKCPKCRSTLATPVEHLPVIYALIPPEELNTSADTNLPAVKRCEKHFDHLDHFCADCNVTVCRRCSRQFHARHRVQFIDDVLNKDEVVKDFTVELQNRMRKNLASIRNVLSKANQMSETIDQMKALDDDIQDYKVTLHALQSTATRDLEAWNNSGRRSLKEKHKLFNTLCHYWNKKKEVLHGDRRRQNFKTTTEKIAEKSKKVQNLGQELSILTSSTGSRYVDSDSDDATDSSDNERRENNNLDAPRRIFIL